MAKLQLLFLMLHGGLLVVAHSGSYHQHHLNKSGNKSQAVACDEESEFKCSKDNRCISLNQVCDFVRDCSDGQDERRCGQCQFSSSPSECGLHFQPAGVFSWFRREMVVGLDDEEPTGRQFYMHTGLDVTRRQYMERLHNNWHITYRPKIAFPQLRPTDNDKCSFSLQLRLTQHEDPELASVKGREPPSWPRVLMMLVQPRRAESAEAAEGFVEGHKPYDLQVLERSKQDGGQGLWAHYLVPVGARPLVWSLELVVEARISSYLVQVADFKFLDCAPSAQFRALATGGAPAATDVELQTAPSTEQPLYSSAACLPGQFKCQSSGQCIDGSLVCDFGYDCGQDDASDEEQCDEHLGRCDFEEPHLCGWLVRPQPSAWLWVEAGDGGAMTHLAKPKVDHTYRQGSLGHYMLLNLDQMNSTSEHSLAGPRVSLRAGFRDCHFRFWYHGARSLDDQLAVSPAYLAVGSQRVPAARLFRRPGDAAAAAASSSSSAAQHNSGRRLEGGLRTYNADWQRLEVELLSRSVFGGGGGSGASGGGGGGGGGYSKRPLESMATLELAFGHLLKDLELFKRRAGHLALDDFSVSPGCQLSLAADLPPPMGPAAVAAPRRLPDCPGGHFQCLVPAPATGARCLPGESYCDFKNDCGLAHPHDPLSSDEQSCPHECHFRFAENCHLEVMDGLALRRAGELRDEELVEEALAWSQADGLGGQLGERSPGHLTMATLESHTPDRWRQQQQQQPANKSAQASGARRLRSLEFRLPVFSRSHANCSYQVELEWANDSQGLRLEWQLENQALAYRHLLKRMDTTIADTKRFSLAFGLGHQPAPFRLIGRLAFADELATSTPAHRRPSGALSIYSYRFVGCSYPLSLVDATREVQVVSLWEEEEEGGEGEGGEEWAEPTDYLDYSEPRLMPRSGGGGGGSSRRGRQAVLCGSQEFQCLEPMACVPREQVCDMQLDCPGGQDEAECGRQLRWDFDGDGDGGEEEEDVDEDDAWLIDVGPTAPLRPPQRGGGGEGGGKLRLEEDAGPPYDHTKSNRLGRHLQLRPRQLLRSPPLQWRHLGAESAGGGGACRLVFYLYDYEGRLEASERAGRGSLRVFRLIGGRREPIYSTPLAGRDDHWRRHSAQVRLGDERPFELLFEWLPAGAHGRHSLLALDDISLGENCQLASGLGSSSASGERASLVAAPGGEEEAAARGGGGWLVLLALLLALGTMGALLAWPRRAAPGATSRPAGASAGGGARQQFSLAQLDLARLTVRPAAAAAGEGASQQHRLNDSLRQYRAQGS